MNMTPTAGELTIVIPAKNESHFLPRLLTSLSRQDYTHIRATKVYVADAGSTDGTADVALAFRPSLDISVIPGGLPSAGRNAGARLAQSQFILFMDADIEFADPTLLRRALEAAKRRRLDCLTTNISCPQGQSIDKLLYRSSNFVQRCASWVKPFGTGMFLLFRSDEFKRLGGFHEEALFAEDYLLTRQISPRRFGILRGTVQTSNRRFNKLGRRRMAMLFLRAMCHLREEAFFLRDQHYWDAAEPAPLPD
jgi:glycosyltransferase involved in cell wall biosynthesis